jgi:hypothetical protein
MATALSCKALAVAALLSVVSVVTYGARAQQQPSHNASDSESSQDRSLLSYSSGWLPAKATWYGAPTGAGPDDNGKDQSAYIYIPVSLHMDVCTCRLNASCCC